MALALLASVARLRPGGWCFYREAASGLNRVVLLISVSFRFLISNGAYGSWQMAAVTQFKASSMGNTMASDMSSALPAAEACSRSDGEHRSHGHRRALAAVFAPFSFTCSFKFPRLARFAALDTLGHARAAMRSLRCFCRAIIVNLFADISVCPAGWRTLRHWTPWATSAPPCARCSTW